MSTSSLIKYLLPAIIVGVVVFLNVAPREASESEEGIFGKLYYELREVADAAPEIYIDISSCNKMSKSKILLSCRLGAKLNGDWSEKLSGKGWTQGAVREVVEWGKPTGETRNFKKDGRYSLSINTYFDVTKMDEIIISY